MGTEREYGLTYIKSRNYVALKFLEIEYFWKKREVIFVNQPLSDGKYCLIVKDAI